MSNLNTFEKITPDIIKKCGVQSLADRPNQPSRYGEGGLTAGQLKLRFDRLATEIINRYNAIVTALSDPEVAASYIALRSVEGGVETLADFLASAVASDAFASELLVNENGETLTQVLKTIRDTLDTRVLDITDGDLANTLIVDTEKETTLVAALGALDSTLTSLNEDIESGELANRMIANVLQPDDATYSDNVSNHLALLQGEISGAQAAYDDADERITTIEGAYLSKTETTAQTLAGPLAVPKINAPDVNADRIYAIESIGTMQNISAGSTISGETVKASWEMIAKQAKVTDDLEVDGNIEVGGDLIVKGATQTAKLENLTIKDNVVIVNSGGINFANSGLVIATSATAEGGYVAYGILYGDTDEVVSIGKGVLKYDENGNASFAFDANEAVPLAARSGAFADGDIPLWDAEKNAFKSSGKMLTDVAERSGEFTAGDIPIWDATKNAFKSSGIKLDEVGGGITEYDYEITEPSQFTTDNLATMRGNILVSCDIEATDDDMSVTIPIGVNLINFNGHYLNYSLYAESLYARYPTCRLISANIGMGVNSYEVTMSNFASVEFCTGNGCFYNCSRIAHSSIWNATSCSFITDVVTGSPESQMATFYNCSNITNVKVEDVSDSSSMGVEFDSCSNISNVTKYGSSDGVITYINCTYVDAFTCVGYGVGVPYVDASGIVSFLERAEGGSYGS